MSCTDTVSGVIPPRTRTWSICVPSHRGERRRPRAHQPLPGRLGRVRAPGRRGAEHRVVERGVEVTRDDHRAGLRGPRTSGRPSPGRCATAGRRRGWGRRSGRRRTAGRPARRRRPRRRESASTGPPATATSPRSAADRCRDALHVAAPLLRRREPVVGHQRGEPVPETPCRLGQGDQVGLRARTDQRGEGVDVRLALVGVEGQHRQRGPGGRVRFRNGHAGQRPRRHHAPPTAATASRPTASVQPRLRDPRRDRGADREHEQPGEHRRAERHELGEGAAPVEAQQVRQQADGRRGDDQQREHEPYGTDGGTRAAGQLIGEGAHRCPVCPSCLCCR